MKHYLDKNLNVYGLDDDITPPKGYSEISVDEIASIVKNKHFESLSYSEKRKSQYPDITEFLDAFVKDDMSLIEEYKKKCLDVKKKFPKPPGL